MSFFLNIFFPDYSSFSRNSDNHRFFQMSHFSNIHRYIKTMYMISGHPTRRPQTGGARKCDKIVNGFHMFFFWQGLLGPPQVNPTRPDPSVGGHAPAHQHPANAPTPWWQRVTKGEPSRPWSATAVMLTVLNCRTHPCLYWITPHRAYMYIMTCEARSSPFMLP